MTNLKNKTKQLATAARSLTSHQMTSGKRAALMNINQDQMSIKDDGIIVKLWLNFHNEDLPHLQVSWFFASLTLDATHQVMVFPLNR